MYLVLPSFFPMERCAVPRVRPVAEADKPAKCQLIQYCALVPEFGGKRIETRTRSEAGKPANCLLIQYYALVLDTRARAEADKPANCQLIQYYARVPEFGGKIINMGQWCTPRIYNR